jgi:hypothetical protein
MARIDIGVRDGKALVCKTTTAPMAAAAVAVV